MVLESTYMDDKMDSANDDKTGIKLYCELPNFGNQLEYMQRSGCLTQQKPLRTYQKLIMQRI